MTPLGDQLRAERERRGAALEQVSGATRIRRTYLEALERHDWKALPADVFTRGYLRSYAQYLGLDEEHLLKAYARQRRISGVDGPTMSERDEHQAARAFLERLARTQGVETRRTGTRITRIALGVVGTGAAALAVWAFLHLAGPGRGGSTAIEVATPRTSFSPAVASMATPLLARLSERAGPAGPSHASHLEVREFGVGTDVVDHRLVGRGDRFEEGSVVWFWTSVVGGRPGDRIQHVWLHGGRAMAVAELDVDGAQWRTQSRRPLPEGSAGDWTVEARDADGPVIARVGFTCVAAE